MRLLLAVYVRTQVRLTPRDDRGDVPGWVLITLMTAGIVAVLWGVAQDDLKTLFHNAVTTVTP